MKPAMPSSGSVKKGRIVLCVDPCARQFGGVLGGQTDKERMLGENEKSEAHERPGQRKLARANADSERGLNRRKMVHRYLGR